MLANIIQCKHRISVDRTKVQLKISQKITQNIDSDDEDDEEDDHEAEHANDPLDANDLPFEHDQSNYYGRYEITWQRAGC